MKDPVTWLYPPIEPYNTGPAPFSPVHEIYFEESGNPSGKPVVFLHGGPAGGSDPNSAASSIPKVRIVNFDQRGCGQSTPYASLEANTTWDWSPTSRNSARTSALSAGRCSADRGVPPRPRLFPNHPESRHRNSSSAASSSSASRKSTGSTSAERRVLYPTRGSRIWPTSRRPSARSALPYYRRLTSDDGAVRLAAAKIWERVGGRHLQAPARPRFHRPLRRG